MNIPANRVGVIACACATEDSAGSIASRNGEATAAPTPRRNVLRGRYRFVMIMTRPPPLIPGLRDHGCIVAGHRAHSERLALDHLQDERLEPGIVLLRFADG